MNKILKRIIFVFLGTRWKLKLVGVPWLNALRENLWEIDSTFFNYFACFMVWQPMRREDMKGRAGQEFLKKSY